MKKEAGIPGLCLFLFMATLPSQDSLRCFVS
jgi:hypothetical protein